MKTSISIKDSSYAVYGLGLSGRSTLNFLKKKMLKRYIAGTIKKTKIIKKNLIYSKSH